MQLTRSSEFYRRRGKRHIGYLFPLRPWLFPAGPCGLPFDAGPFSDEGKGSSSHEFRSATEYVTGPHPLSVRRPKATYLEVSFLIATSTDWVQLTLHIPVQPRSALGVSHTLDGFIPGQSCGLISFHSHVQDSLYRGFPRYQAGLPHRHPVPS
jgi:hypothetical protein